jgi:ferredoxin-type protein NapF
MADLSKSVVSRRNFLRGHMRSEPVQREEAVASIRPPWTDETSVQKNCTSCGECISACPEAILSKDLTGKPAVSFDGGECTFCGACAESCPETVFDRTWPAPWAMSVAINQNCLLQAGVTCQLCTDSCDAEALTFDLRVRPYGAVKLDEAACTGCGACISMCPVMAIDIIDQRAGTAA